MHRLGKHGGNSGMWGGENAIDPSTASSALAARELDDAFVEGMDLLRNYRVSKAGGIEAIVQLACDLATRRLTETQASTQTSSTTIGARLRSSMWGFGSQPSIKEVHEDYTETEDESSDEDEPLQKAAVAKPDTNGEDAQNRPSISSRLANTVWKGSIPSSFPPCNQSRLRLRSRFAFSPTLVTYPSPQTPPPGCLVLLVASLSRVDQTGFYRTRAPTSRNDEMDALLPSCW